MNQAEDLLIASQFAEQEQQQNELREGQVPKVIEKSVEKDNIDAAISGDAVEKDYDSSELEISSDEEESSEEEEEEDKKPKKVVMMDDDEEEGGQSGPLKTANEITTFTVEKPVFELTQQTEILFAGSVLQVIDSVIVVQSRPGSEYNALDAGSLLVYENRQVMGEVFETFGPIARPFYTVRFNDASEIDIENTKVGTAIYYVPAYQKTQIIQTERLRMIKHTDASNFYDEEAGEDEMDFSDDEKELAYRQQKNREKKMKKNARKSPVVNGPNKKPKPSSDFDTALDSYQNIPPRQQQSYADL